MFESPQALRLVFHWKARALRGLPGMRLVQTQPRAPGPPACSPGLGWRAAWRQGGFILRVFSAWATAASHRHERDADLIHLSKRSVGLVKKWSNWSFDLLVETKGSLSPCMCTATSYGLKSWGYASRRLGPSPPVSQPFAQRQEQGPQALKRVGWITSWVNEGI